MFHFSSPVGETRKFPPSPAWHRNQRRLRARARVAVRSGLVSKDQTLRLQRHHGSTLPRVMTWYGGAGNSSWCAGCRSRKWERGTRCYCKTKKGAKKAQSDGNLLDSNAVLAYASRSDLETTIRQLERTRASLVAAPDAEAAVRVRMESLKTEIYTREPPCVQMSELHGALERAAKQVDAKKEALAKATAALAGAEDHYRELVDRRRALAAREEEQDFYEENDYDMEADRVGDWWQADKPGNSWQESWCQSHWKEDDRTSLEPVRPSLENDMLKSAMAEAQQTQHAFQQSILAENAKFQQTVAGMLGKFWEEAQRAPSTPAGTGAPSTPN